QGDAELVVGPAHRPADEDEHVGGGGAVGGDDEVGGALADPGPAVAFALHAEQLDHPAGGHLGRVGEHAAAVGLVHRLVVAPPAAGLLYLGGGGARGRRDEGDPGRGHHRPGREGRAPVAEAELV